MNVSAFFLIFILNIPIILTAPPPLPSFDKQVNALLAKMTDEEKVGQMTQITLKVVLKDPTAPWDQTQIDPVKLAAAIQDYKIGSILNVGTAALSLNLWHDVIGQIQDEAQKTRLSIPVLYGIDSIHGANYVRDAVIFPHATGLAATFNTTLAYEIGKISAHQTRAAGIPWAFHPQLDIGYISVFTLVKLFNIDFLLVVNNYGHDCGKHMVKM
jgi:beta-glucosidase